MEQVDMVQRASTPVRTGAQDRIISSTTQPEDNGAKRTRSACSASVTALNFTVQTAPAGLHSFHYLKWTEERSLVASGAAVLPFDGGLDDWANEGRLTARRLGNGLAAG